jgi:mono/diheme cytochrome c family protein
MVRTQRTSCIARRALDAPPAPFIMRTLFKILIILVLIVVSCGAAGIGFLYARYPDVPEPENINVTATPEKIERGRYLSNHVSGCVVCHAERDMTRYSGPVKDGTSGAGGEFFGDLEQGVAVYSTNITPAAIGGWSDGQLIRAITTGVSADGEPLFPIMPYAKFGRMAREDIEAIVAYIRTLKPVHSTIPARELPFPLPFVVRTMPQPAQFRPIPPKSDRLAYGEYLTNAAVCADCHTPRDDQGQPIPGREFSGGQEFKLPNGGVNRPMNITPDADTGIGTWTEQQFIDRFKAWRDVEPRQLDEAEQRENTIMPWISYAGMTDEDLGAIYRYLRSLKPVVNRVQPFE